jgi:Na+/alanine symporter
VGCTNAGSILATDFKAVEKKHEESGGSIFVCNKVMSNNVEATVSSQGQ